MRLSLRSRRRLLRFRIDEAASRKRGAELGQVRSGRIERDQRQKRRRTGFKVIKSPFALCDFDNSVVILCFYSYNTAVSSSDDDEFKTSQFPQESALQQVNHINVFLKYSLFRYSFSFLPFVTAL